MVEERRSKAEDRESPAWASGGGQSGALLRAIDWSKNPLGPVDRWPASLRTTIGILLHSRHPMFLWWGPDLIQFYNDAYLPSFGVGKHPAAMGQRGRDCWPEIWSIIGPQIDDVMKHGVASWNEDQLVPIFRNGRIEEVYWTYGYSPVVDEQGELAGTLVVCTETTSRMIASRRLHLLRTVVDQTVVSEDVAATMHSATSALREAGADLPFVLVFSADPRSHEVQLLETVGLAPGDLSARFGADFERELPSLADRSARAGAQPLGGAGVAGGPWPEPVTEIYVATLAQPEAGARRGFVVFGLSPRLPFDGGYRSFLDQIAAHLAVVRARVDAAHMRTVIERERDNLLMQAPVAVSIISGPDHTYQLANPRYLQMVGRQVVGKRYLEAFPEVAGTLLPGILERVYRTGEPFVSEEHEIPLDRGDGMREERFFRFNIEPMRDPDGDVYGMMTCAMDITAQVRGRRELERINTERERLLTELEAANRAKDEFFAMLGHELRNPLSPIVTAVQLMKRHGDRDTSKERNVIERQVQHLVRLVDDLLDVSKITRGKVALKREIVDLADVLRNAVEIASVLLEQRAHTLSIDVEQSGLFWEGDPVRLAQAVANLLTNAARYTPPGGRIQLGARRAGAEVVISVTDNGAGISAEMLPNIFELFVQGERQVGAGPGPALGGLGIGLTLARTLVSLHGGTISATSAGPGRGSTFVIRLPAPLITEAEARAAAEPSRPATGFTAAAHPQRVLVIDDNVDAAEVLGEYLQEDGHEVKVVNDPIAALEALEALRPSVAIVDIGMPVMDGYDLAERMRQTAAGRECRLIAVTGYGQEQDKQRSRKAGFSSHLVKPVDLEELSRIVDRA
jgi:signal transduction histidine kinase